MQRLHISIVIPTLNEISYLPNLLKSIADQSWPVHEVIVVDANSTDGTAQLTQSLKSITYLNSVKQNIAAQRSTGADHCTGDVILFLDADCELPKDFIKIATILLQKTQSDFLIPYYQAYPGTKAINFVFSFFNTLFYLGQFAWPSGVGSCILIRRAIWQKVKPFNQQVLVEDLEFIHWVGKRCQFAVSHRLRILVSDRRFREEGVWKVFRKYLQISYHGLLNQWQQTNHINYDFGQHDLQPHVPKSTR